MLEMKIDIRNLSEDQIIDFFKEKGFDSYRGRQVYEWIWKKSSHSFDDMTNLSKELRLMLDSHFVINHIEVDKIQKSSDGTIKNAVKLVIVAHPSSKDKPFANPMSKSFISKD